MNKQQALIKKAEWLAQCIEFGWEKDQLEDLSNLWDKFKDEYGQMRNDPFAESPAPSSPEGWVSEAELLAKWQAEAEEMYPVEDVADFTKNKQMDNAFAVVMQEAHLTACRKRWEELEAANKRIKELEGLLALTESQRKEWADTAIRFKKQIDTPNNIDY